MAYATITDLTTVGLAPNALGNTTVAQQNAALQGASDYADSFFRARWGTAGVPFVAWDSQITESVAKIAAYRLMLERGMRPDGADWRIFRQGYDDAVAWLDKVQRQQAHPKVTLANVNAPGAVQPQLNSASVVNVATGRRAPNRGW